MSTVHLRSNFKDLFTSAALPVLDMLRMDEYMQHQDLRPALLNMESTDRDIAQNASLASLGRFQQTSDNEVAPLDEISQSYNKTFKILDYTKMIAITKQMIRDEKWGLIEKAIKSIGRSAHETQQVLMFNLFNGAFSAASTAAFDGKAWIASDHPSLDGDQSNTLAAQSDLSATSLKEAETVFRKMKDERGKRLNILPKTLLVPSDISHTARELVESPFLPGTANNNLNSIGKYQVIDSPYLTDTDAWFLVAAPQDHGARAYIRQEMETELDVDVKARTAYYVADFREAYGVDEWRGIVGSDGSAA